MRYRFEIISSFGSAADVCVGCMFEEEQFSPLQFLQRYAAKHFGPSGPGSVGDKLEMHRHPLDQRIPCVQTNFCSAVFEEVNSVPTIRMLPGAALLADFQRGVI